MGSTRKPWNYALVQHPMWLIIDEDSICAERTPPWGCASIEEYADRLGKGMDALERWPELHLNFDFSAVELEDLDRRFPVLMARIRELTGRGRISFVNGTYSQPHLQMLSVESMLRQFEYGLSAIERLLGYRVNCYAAQEPGLTPQVPQVLRALGYVSAAGPDFPYGVELIRGRIQHWDKRWEWLAGDDLVKWRGLDGAEIPFWLKPAGRYGDRVLADEHQHGLLGHTRLQIETPDMVEVNTRWIEERASSCEFVRLDKALEAMAVEHPPESVARIDANYAYLEGADAEALPRANARAEVALLSLEAAAALLGPGEPLFDLDSAWETLLKCQHHDAYWTGAPELRAKSIAWLDEMTAALRAALSKALDTLAANPPAPEPGSEPVMVLHPYARPHKVPIALAVEPGGVTLADSAGGTVPAQPSEDGAALVFAAESRGAGHAAWSLKRDAPVPASREGPFESPFGFANRFYSAQVRPDGVVESASAGDSGDAVASSGNLWLFQSAGKDVRLHQETAAGRVVRGPVFDSCTAVASIGGIQARHRLRFYHDLPWFEVEASLAFDEPTEIGDFFDDRSKLHHAWRVPGPVSIRHAVGGCPAEARRGRGFVVNPWVDLAGDHGGISLCLFEAAKCWVDEDGWLRRVVGWGHNGDHFHNRQGPLPGIMGPLNWKKPMDLRLRGEHTVRYCAWPHAGRASDGDIADWAASLMLPPVARQVSAGDFRMPQSWEFASIETPGAIPLSLRPADSKTAVLRVMDFSGKESELRVSVGSGWRVESVVDLSGADARRLRPYAIAEVHLVRSR